DFGRLEYWLTRNRHDADLPEWCRGFDDRDFGRDHGKVVSHFEATSVDSAVFSDQFPPAGPGKGSVLHSLWSAGFWFAGWNFPPGPPVDSVRFTGTGRWNGVFGYAFVATATDQGEPGRHHDTFTLVIKDPAGNIVANVGGALDSGN